MVSPPLLDLVHKDALIKSADRKAIQICLAAPVHLIKFNSVHIASRLFKQYKFHSCHCILHIFLSWTQPQALHYMSQCVKAMTKHSSVSFSCCHSRALDGCYNVGLYSGNIIPHCGSSNLWRMLQSPFFHFQSLLLQLWFQIFRN